MYSKDMRKERYTKYIVPIFLIGVLIVLSLLAIDHFKTKEANNHMMQQTFLAINADPDAVTVTDGNTDITELFLETYLADIKAGAYDDAISEIRANGYSISISRNNKTIPFLDENE